MAAFVSSSSKFQGRDFIMDSLRHQMTLNDLTFTDMISPTFTDLIGVCDISVSYVPIITRLYGLVQSRHVKLLNIFLSVILYPPLMCFKSEWRMIFILFP